MNTLDTPLKSKPSENLRTEPSARLGKARSWWMRHSRIGAPLAPHDSEARPGEALPNLDAPPAERAPGLDSACSILEPLLPAGMTLRAMGGFDGDRAAIYDHWATLGEHGIYSRFFIRPSDYMLRKRAAEADFDNPRFAGIFDSQGKLACLAEWALEPGDPLEAEAAFSTSPSHRRLGLATIAAAACAIDARASGIERLRIDTLRENVAAQGLARRLGGARESKAAEGWDDSVSSYIDLRNAGELSIEARLGLSHE